MFKVQINWSRRKEILIAENEETLKNLLSWHNDKPKGKGYCRVKLVGALLNYEEALKFKEAQE